MSSRPLGIFLSLALALTLGRSTLAQPMELTPTDKNAEAMHEALVMAVSMLTSELGLGPDFNSFNYNGTFGEDGWTADLDGTAAGLTVDFSFTGSFVPATNLGAFTASGLLGGDPWSGSGQWAFIDTGVGLADFSWDFESSFFGKLIDRHSVGPIKNVKQGIGDVISKTDFGQYRRTIFGIPVGRPFYVQLSDWIYPKDRPDQATVRFDLPDESIFLVGTADFAGGTARGTITAVPEPASLVAVGLGAVALLFLRRRREPR